MLTLIPLGKLEEARADTTPRIAFLRHLVPGSNRNRISGGECITSPPTPAAGFTGLVTHDADRLRQLVWIRHRAYYLAMTFRLLVKPDADTGRWSAVFPELPGCAAAASPKIFAHALGHPQVNDAWRVDTAGQAGGRLVTLDTRLNVHDLQKNSVHVIAS